MPAPEEVQLRKALKGHDNTFVYIYVNNEDEPGDVESLIEFIVDESLKEADLESTDDVLVTAVHASVPPRVIVKAFYDRGYQDGIKAAQRSQDTPL